MRNPDKRDALFAQVESITFKSQACTLVEDAERDYEAQQPTPDQGDLGKAEEAWSVLANQIVGHETF